MTEKRFFSPSRQTFLCSGMKKKKIRECWREGENKCTLFWDYRCVSNCPRRKLVTKEEEEQGRRERSQLSHLQTQGLALVWLSGLGKPLKEAAAVKR